MTTRRRMGYGLACVAVLALAACRPAKEPRAPEPVRVSAMALHPEAVTVYEALPGRVAAVRSAEIRPQVGGIVQRRLFDQGADVVAGQPLFQINAAPFKADADMAAASLQRSQAAWRRATAQAERLKPLMQAEAVSHQEYEDAVAQREQAAAEVAQAEASLARRRLDLRFARVDAPIAGRIDQAVVSEGALVGAADATPMARIQQIDKVYVDVRQPAAALEALRTLGASPPVTLLRADGRPYPMRGQVLFSATHVDPATGDVLLRILVDNPGRVLLPGMFVRAQLVKGRYEQALLVPQQAVKRSAGQAKVWTVEKTAQGDVARLLSLQLGEAVGQNWRVVGGLQPGQRVVVEGAERLAAGTAVAPQPWQAPTVADSETAATAAR